MGACKSKISITQQFAVNNTSSIGLGKIIGKDLSKPLHERMSLSLPTTSSKQCSQDQSGSSTISASSPSRGSNSSCSIEGSTSNDDTSSPEDHSKSELPSSPSFVEGEVGEQKDSFVKPNTVDFSDDHPMGHNISSDDHIREEQQQQILNRSYSSEYEDITVTSNSIVTHTYESETDHTADESIYDEVTIGNSTFLDIQNQNNLNTNDYSYYDEELLTFQDADDDSIFSFRSKPSTRNDSMAFDWSGIPDLLNLHFGGRKDISSSSSRGKAREPKENKNLPKSTTTNQEVQKQASSTLPTKTLLTSNTANKEGGNTYTDGAISSITYSGIEKPKQQLKIPTKPLKSRSYDQTDCTYDQKANDRNAISSNSKSAFQSLLLLSPSSTTSEAEFAFADDTSQYDFITVDDDDKNNYETEDNMSLKLEQASTASSPCQTQRPSILFDLSGVTLVCNNQNSQQQQQTDDIHIKEVTSFHDETYTITSNDNDGVSTKSKTEKDNDDSKKCQKGSIWRGRVTRVKTKRKNLINEESKTEGTSSSLGEVETKISTLTTSESTMTGTPSSTNANENPKVETASAVSSSSAHTGTSKISPLSLSSQTVTSSTLHMIPGTEIVMSKPMIWATVSKYFPASDQSTKDYDDESTMVDQQITSLIQQAQETLLKKTIDVDCNAILGVTTTIAADIQPSTTTKCPSSTFSATDSQHADAKIIIVTLSGTPCTVVSTRQSMTID